MFTLVWGGAETSAAQLRSPATWAGESRFSREKESIGDADIDTNTDLT